jgi:hypothetical protein
MINIDSIATERDRQLIIHLQNSSLELDKVIHHIVAKTSTAMEDADNEFVI